MHVGLRTGIAVLGCAVAAAAGGAAPGSGRDASARYTFKQISAAFVDPTYVTTAPGNPSTLYVVEQAGRIRTWRSGRVTGTFLDIRDRVRSGGEYGLLSIAFHPKYAQNHRFYVDYTDLDGNTRVVELVSVQGVPDLTSARQLLFVEQPYPNHKGGQLAFDRQGYLYVGMGDGGTNPANGPTGIGDPENRAQNLDSKLGKLLRINPDEARSSWQTVGYGLRNPWRFSFDRLTGDLWIADVGAAKYEEIDFRPRSLVATIANYGWSRFEGRSLYNPAVALTPGGTYIAPAWTYAHREHLCGVIGGYVYRGRRLPQARGRYFFGDLCSGGIRSFKIGKAGPASPAVQLAANVRALSSFGEGSNGELYAVGLDGALYALR